MKAPISIFSIVLIGSCLHAQETQTLDATQAAPAPTPVALESGVAALAPANTSIGFVGVHEGPKPDPRKGGFAKFAGKLQADDTTVTAVGFEIDTTSLFTEFPKLTGHLKSPDFFDVREHPKASFQSTSVAAAEEAGQVVVTGEFSLLGVKKEIEIPATVSVTPAGVTVLSKFDVDRTQFGMTYGEGKVKKNVTISVAVGLPTTSPDE